MKSDLDMPERATHGEEIAEDLNSNRRNKDNLLVVSGRRDKP